MADDQKTQPKDTTPAAETPVVAPKDTKPAAEVPAKAPKDTKPAAEVPVELDRSDERPPVKLRYLGGSHVLKDEATGLVFAAGGDAHEITAYDADRLLNASRYDIFEIVTD